METTLALLFWSAIGFICISILRLLMLKKAYPRMRDKSEPESPEKRRGNSLRDALSGLVDAIESMF